MKKEVKEKLINALLANDISHTDLLWLCQAAAPEDLNQLVVRVFDMDEASLLKKAAVIGFTAKLNKLKNKQRASRYKKKVRKHSEQFRNGNGQFVVLAEGDSWFNYPLLLSDVLDWIAMEPNIALYSLAEGADWFLNMINKREYVEGLGIHNPHFLLLSGGGNDIVGLSRVAVIVDRDASRHAYDKNEWVQEILVKRYFGSNDRNLPLTGSFDKDRLLSGVMHLNKDFFALLMLFKVQYHFILGKLVEGTTDDEGNVINPSKYPDLKILTQGYDYPIPDSRDGIGFNLSKWYVPLLRQVNHGGWLQMPLMMKGVPMNKHSDVMYAMIFLFNEMMIDIAYHFNVEIVRKKQGKTEPRIYHIDNRGIVPPNGWTDELHPTPRYFRKVGSLFIKCINGIPSQSNCPFIYDLHNLKDSI